MTEYWVSQSRKFCDVCKCWITDNKASIAFHENGRKHQFAVENQLKDIRYRSGKAEAQKAKEADIIAQMEAAAMKQYRTKDLEANPDITANIFNQRRAERDAQKEEFEEARQARIAENYEKLKASGKGGGGGGGGSGGQIGPQIPQYHPAVSPQSDNSNATRPSTSKRNPLSAASVYEMASKSSSNKEGIFKTVRALTTGTKYHKDSGTPKKWMEAKTDDGHTYYWHVETNESKWEAPYEGYLSIKEQEDINNKHTELAAQKVDKIEESRKVHGRKRRYDGSSDEEEEEGPAQGPAAKPTPYGQWQTVEKSAYEEEAAEAAYDFQTPKVKNKNEPAVKLQDDGRRSFKTKETPSLGGASGSNSSSGGFAFKKKSFANKKQFRRGGGDE